jgi:hypothetical protein
MNEEDFDEEGFCELYIDKLIAEGGGMMEEDKYELEIDTLDYGNSWRVEFPDMVIVMVPKTRKKPFKITYDNFTVILPKRVELPEPPKEEICKKT